MIEKLFNINRKLNGKLLTFYLKFGFGSFGKRSLIYKASILKGMKYIHIGNAVTIFDYGWLIALPIEGRKPRLFIGNNTDIGRFSHIVCTQSVKIGCDVLIADKVFITDTTHCFEHDMPIKEQGLKFIGKVNIGDGTWIGEGAVIAGCKIGKNCVIGANSFVNRDIPDNSVCFGSPARVKNVES